MRFSERLRLISRLLLIGIIAIGLGCGGGGKGKNAGGTTTYSISGKVTIDSAALSGVTITLSGNSTGIETTDSNGNYSFSGLRNGSYTLTPSKGGYTFDPSFKNITIAGSNQQAVNFIISPSISGRITSNGIGLSGATITLSGSRTAITATDNNGNYFFTGLSNGSYTVAPSKSGYGFEPQYINVTITGPNQIDINFAAQPVRLEIPQIKKVYGIVNLPDQSPINPANLKVQSILTNVNANPGGYFYNLPVIDEGGGQIVFVLDNQDNPIMVAYISRQSVANGMITAGAREMALGLIAFNPYLMILSQDQRESILVQAETHPDFNSLVSYIEAALIQSPENALDYETYPYIYQIAMSIGLKILESYGDNSPGHFSNYIVLSSVGGEDDPHIDDPTGPLVTFVNPKMVFYGIEVNPPAGGVDDILLRGKGSFFSARLGWPPIVPTAPHEHNFNLGDGTFTLTFYKGFNTSVSGWLNPWTAPGKATYGNFLKCIAIVLDIFGAQWYMKLNDTTIFYLLSAVNPPSLYFDTSFGDALETANWMKLLKDCIIPYLKNHWDEIAYWVYQQWPGDKTAQAMQSALKIIDGVSNAIWPVKILVLGAKGTNEYIPFFSDLATAPSILEYKVKQTSGVLSEVSSLVPPTAAFTFNPLQPYVGQTVNFDASNSHDDKDPTSSLEVRWDFDGNGSWDTSWSTYKNASSAFTQRGSFNTALQVKDTDGQIGHTSHSIYVGSSEELKVVLTWGENPSDLDSHLWTPEIEGNKYHICYWQKYHDLTNPPYVMLDLDDVTSFGPETIWFERIYPGTYIYAVHKYAGSGELTTSSATVTVIDRNGVKATFNVPSSGSGSWWTVFEMNGVTKQITPINIIGDNPPQSYISLLNFPPKEKK